MAGQNGVNNSSYQCKERRVSLPVAACKLVFDLHSHSIYGQVIFSKIGHALE